MDPGVKLEAKARRTAMLANLRRVVRLCNCAWPIQTYRNGDGHHPECPAHVKIGAQGR